MNTSLIKFDVRPPCGYNHLEIYQHFFRGAREAMCNTGAREGCHATAMVALICLICLFGFLRKNTNAKNVWMGA